jgi:STE24 endopeptidase
MIEILYCSILFVLIVNFVFERWLDYLNTTQWTSELPPELSGIYDEEKYQKSQEYEKATYRFTVVTESLGFIAILIIFAT